MRSLLLIFLAPLVTLLATGAEDGKPVEWPGLKFHHAPNALPAGAVSSEWPRFQGPIDVPISPETKLLKELKPEGPPKVWECEIGAGYASPVISGNYLVFFHRPKNVEEIVCLHPETGKKYWSLEYPVEYNDRYGYAAGPRGSAVISGEIVITFGVTSWLHAVDLKTGKILWKHDCATEFAVPQYFFGSGSSPIVSGDIVMVNLGGEGGLCVAGFDLKTGAVKWKTNHESGQSYASPIMATLQGQSRAVFFTGGESKPSTGSVLSIDPKTGGVDDAFFWRANRYTSVNASSPIPCGPNRVFVSQAYVDSGSECNGGVMLEMNAERKWTALWKAPALGCHWMTPVYLDGYIYAFSGEKEYACELVCYDAASGKLVWKEQPSWETTLPDGRKIPMGFKRGSLLRVDGRFLCLGEWGTLAWLDLSPKGMTILSKTQPFISQQSWTMPAISHGLLYLTQHEKDEITGAPPRLICYDLRAESAK